ncbi:SDR family NAD(P)-dependent oxidoreductase [Nocardia sp. BMG111209]|uniref:SDR family NAD(P)-dependent oxidoreductase n=1 Tax=Nocardia sp. BMG111209 TaxID=1160137 RepID=UPI00037A5A53|nr:SDR family NAD(P)-dependent oxidoreductase [Nocardia sp. BMG111209]
MSDTRFDGKVAVVTGAGHGLGRQHALLLAARGARVVVNDIGGTVSGTGRDDGPAAAVVREIRDNGGEAVADANTVATAAGGRAIVDTAIARFGRVDIVVNNAGILRDAPFHDMTPDRLDALIDVHLKGAFHVTGPAWAVMREQRYGRVVNTTSAAGLFGAVEKSNYGAAKTGLLGFTRVLAAEGAEHDIKVNAIAPIAATRMLAQALADAAGGADPDTVAMLQAFTDKLDPALVSPVVAFLAHEDCPVSGAVFSAGGGQVARVFLGRAAGYYHPALSIEHVRDHQDEILDTTNYTIPADSGDEIADLFRAMADDAAATGG